MFATRIKRGRVNPPDKVAGRMRCIELGMRESVRERRRARGYAMLACGKQTAHKEGKNSWFPITRASSTTTQMPQNWPESRVCALVVFFFFFFAFSISRCARHLLPSTDGGGVHISGRFDGIELNIYRLVFGVARDLRQVIRR